MPWWTWFLVGIAVLAVVYAAFVAALVLARRRGEARMLATFIPDCIVLVSRLGDPRAPRRRKLLGRAASRPLVPVPHRVGRSDQRVEAEGCSDAIRGLVDQFEVIDEPGERGVPLRWASSEVELRIA